MAASEGARSISTNQTGVHDKLDELVLRYQASRSQRPVSDHTQAAFEEVSGWLTGKNGPIIIDSCCGVGQSTAAIAAQFPQARVIGVDKSAQRLAKHHHYQAPHSNYLVIRADVIDFWRLAVDAKWPVSKHFLLYPNPYPKSAQVQKRWHASASMKDIMALCSNIEVRSNWLIYLLEFSQAAQQYGLQSDLTEIAHAPPLTPFEKKYQDSGQTCWQLCCHSEED